MDIHSFFLIEDILEIQMPAEVILYSGEPGRSVELPIKETAFLQAGAFFEARLVDVQLEQGKYFV